MYTFVWVKRNWMGLRGSCLVFFPDLYGLVTLGSDHPQGRPVEQDIENGRLALQRARLQRAFNLLEVVARLPVEEVQPTIV